MIANPDVANRIATIEARLQELKSIGIPGNYPAGGILFGGTNGKAATDTALTWSASTDTLKIGGGNVGIGTVNTIDALSNDGNATSAIVGYGYEYINDPGATQVTAGKFNTLLLAAVDGSGGANTSGALVGFRSDVRYRQTAGTWNGILYGVDSVLRHSGAGTLVNALGVRAIPILSSTGGLSTWYGLLAEQPSITSSGGIANVYAVRINNQTIAGIGNAWAIYQVGASDSNYFNGPCGFGETSPATRLDIKGTVSNYATGPNIDFTTSADAYRAFQILPYAHDNINIGFDAWYNGTNWTSGDAGSNFLVRKNGDLLQFLRATPVAAGSTIATWNLELAITNDGFVQFGANAVRQTGKFFSIANAGVVALGGNNWGFALLQNGSGAAMYIINGTAHTTQEVFDPAGIYSPTAGTATSFNIYWSAGNSRYELQNNRGSTQNVRVWLFDAA